MLFIFLSFLMLPKPKVAFSLCILLLCSICVWFSFSPSFERDSTVYVYKLNEDIILYKHSSRTIKSSSHLVLAPLQHKPGHLMTVQKEDLKNHVGSCTTPLASLSLLIKKAHTGSLPSFPFSSLKTGWSSRMEFCFLVILCFRRL